MNKYIKIGAEAGASKVRRFSIVALVFSPLMAIYNIGIYFFSSIGSNYNLGVATASLVWGLTFVIPLKLSAQTNSPARKLAGFIVFICALFSGIVLFGINNVINK